MNSYDWTPDASTAPNKYEPGTVVFEGWYLNPECTGEKFDFTTHTMPSGTNDGDTTLTLYAKWVPVTRTVEFYLDQDDMENNTDMLAKRETPHGSVLNPVLRRRPTAITPLSAGSTWMETRKRALLTRCRSPRI